MSVVLVVLGGVAAATAFIGSFWGPEGRQRVVVPILGTAIAGACYAVLMVVHGGPWQFSQDVTSFLMGGRPLSCDHSFWTGLWEIGVAVLPLAGTFVPLPGFVLAVAGILIAIFTQKEMGLFHIGTILVAFMACLLLAAIPVLLIHFGVGGVCR